MQIQNQFEIPMPPDAAWPLLMNIPATVPCFPGAELLETIDPQSYKGRGNAITVTRFAMRQHGSGTIVDVDSDVQLAGQVAQYGRGAGMISEISAQLISKFAENLRAHINAMSPPSGEPVTEQTVILRATEISVLQLLWNALVNRFKRLFNH